MVVNRFYLLYEDLSEEKKVSVDLKPQSLPRSSVPPCTNQVAIFIHVHPTHEVYPNQPKHSNHLQVKWLTRIILRQYNILLEIVWLYMEFGTRRPPKHCYHTFPWWRHFLRTDNVPHQNTNRLAFPVTWGNNNHLKLIMSCKRAWNRHWFKCGRCCKIKAPIAKTHMTHIFSLTAQNGCTI